MRVRSSRPSSPCPDHAVAGAHACLDVTPNRRGHLGLELGASGVLAWQGEEAMRKSRFNEEQILFALKQRNAGQPIADVCRRMGISEATYYNWKKRYGNLGLLEVRELRQLRDENARLKRLVADLTLDRHVLQEVIRERASHAQTARHSPMDTGLPSAESATRLPAELPAQRHLALPPPSPRQQRLATAAARTGDGQAAIRLRTAAHLLTRESWPIRRDRIHRLYKLVGLQVRMRVRQRKRSASASVSACTVGPLPPPPAADSTGPWILSMTSWRTGGSPAC